MIEDVGRRRGFTAWLAACALYGIFAAGFSGCSSAVDLNKGIQVTGAAVPGIYSPYPERDSRQWKIRLNVVNTAGINIGLGQDLILVENDAAGTGIVGVYHSRGRTPEGPEKLEIGLREHHWALQYGLTNFNLLWADGSMIGYRDPGRYQGPGGQETDPEMLSFGSLPAGKTRKLELEMKEGTWLSPAEGLRIALPALIVKSGAKEDRYRLVVYFKKPADPEQQPWSVARTEVVPLVPAGLVAQLKRSDLDPAARIFAANWLMEANPKQGAVAVAETAKTLQGGPLLASCLNLLANADGTGDAALASRALELLSNQEIPTLTRSAAAAYLGHVRYQAAREALKAVTQDYYLGGPARRALKELDQAASQAK